MIQDFVDKFMAAKPELRSWLIEEGHPDDYKCLVEKVISVMGDEYDAPDCNRVHEINDGMYQGTLVYVIASKEYQPCTYWYVMVDYGSCTVCDTLEGIRRYDDGAPSEQQVDDYMSLMLHIVQGLKEMELTYD